MMVNFVLFIFKDYESLLNTLHKKYSLSMIIKLHLFTVTNSNPTLVTVKTTINYEEAIIVELAKDRCRVSMQTTY